MSIEPSHKILRKNISSKNLSNPCSLIISLPDLLHKSLPLKFYAKVFHRKTFPPCIHLWEPSLEILSKNISSKNSPPVHPPLGAFPWISPQKYFIEKLPPRASTSESLALNFYAKIFHRKTSPPPVHPPSRAFPWNSTLKYFIEKLVPPPVHPGENKQRQHIENRNPKKVIYIRVFDFDDFQIFRFFRFSEFFRYFFDTHDYESNDIMMCV